MINASVAVNSAGDAPELNHWLRHSALTCPNHLAILGPDTTLTYAELAGEVAALAAQFRGAGLRTGDRVALASSRSVPSIVTILAAVDAGLAYVPLDLSYPSDRLKLILAETQPLLVHGSQRELATLTSAVGPVPTLQNPAPAERSPSSTPADLVYVLFTSGSTGRPKGVAMGAEPLKALIAWHVMHPRLGRPARVLQFAPLTFDVHFQEIFSTLACRGTLVLMSEAQRRDPDLLGRALSSLRIERLFVPYVALQLVAEAARNEAPAYLRDVISAGEQLKVTPVIRSLFARLPGAELHNHYGPTESHVVTAHELRGDSAAWPDLPMIGRPLPHVELALLASDGSVASGAGSGELLIGGQSLAHGYLARIELTRERFLDHVQGLKGRWYRSGDLVSRDAEGQYTYEGRADQQLKVDGFRIEPGEIESLLLQDKRLKDAVVTAPELAGLGRQLTAYLVWREGEDAGPAAATTLRAALRQVLPDYMVPVRFETLKRLPTTPSGKIDRSALPLPVSSRPTGEPTDVANLLRSTWSDLLGQPQIADDQNLFDLGAKSLSVLRFVATIRERGVTGISPADVYNRPTLGGLIAHLNGEGNLAQRRRRPGHTQDGIAIIGMATRTAGAQDVEAFWANLLSGKEGIRHFTAAELDGLVPAALRSRPNFVAARGVLEDAGRFDAGLFGVSSREAVMLDPQQRLTLELCWAALEHAAIDSTRSPAVVGVYAGTGNNGYAPALAKHQPELVQQFGEFATMLASEKDYVATRVAHRLGLTGPAISVHTACSTGLVAVVQACSGLSSGQCDIALAGGASIIVPQVGGHLHVEGGIESADGHCRPFDAEASGTVFASGGGIVVLKRLADAVADGDTIHGVIRGVGLNNDGADKASFTAPSVRGQAAAIRMALDQAGLDARRIGYVEAHGTATALGDPIELAALTEAWRSDTSDCQFAHIGSVKGNLGHLTAGAGIVGLIKTTLALARQVIPATLHFKNPNPLIDFASTPFRVVAETTPWPRGGTPRFAAVSSFGVGGTNAHVIVEEPPAAPVEADDGRAWLLPLSAATSAAVVQRAHDLADHLVRHPNITLPAVARTLMRGRRNLPYRLAPRARNVTEAVAALRQLTTAGKPAARPRVVFLLPGQGSQSPGMARGLTAEFPAFALAMETCLAVVEPLLGPDFRHLLLEADPGDAHATEQLCNTQYAQPATFCVSYALGRWLDSVGVTPDALIGHSVGEYAAACLAGVMTVQDAARAVVARGAAMAAQPTGAMLAVRLDPTTLQPLLTAEVEIAGVNAPSLTVVAGPHAAIAALQQALTAREIEATPLKVSHAFHSASMVNALPLVHETMAGVALSAPRITTYSGVTGEALTAKDALNPACWARQARAPVLFSKALASEIALGRAIFVEVGAGQALTALARQHRCASGEMPLIASLQGAAGKSGDAGLAALAGLSALWVAGVDVAWPVAAHAQRIPLPTYPFGGQNYWFSTPTNPPQECFPAASSGEEADTLKIKTSTPETSIQSPAHMKRLPHIEQELTSLLSEVSGLTNDELAQGGRFVDLGLDSLSLTQATLEIERVFGIRLRFRRLLEDLDDVAKLAAFLDRELPADKFAPPPATPAAALAAPVASAHSGLPILGPVEPGAAANTVLHQLIQQQLQLMAQQLAAVSAQAAQAPLAPAMLLTAAATTPVPRAPASPVVAKPEEGQAPAPSLLALPFGASARITLNSTISLSPSQQLWLDEFVVRYNNRTARSKQFTQENRKVMADPRVVTGFNPMWKELVYPIVVDRSQGARMWDLDGNEYIDLLSCFGANLLGYQPPDIVQAMVDQLHTGIELGPQHPLAAEVASLISEFTRMERVAFCNTGSEAVIGALRIARTVTGRRTVAIFTNSYHGIADEVIVRSSSQSRPLAAAPGIPPGAVANMLVLDYASDDSLRILREKGPELAAIMIEPIQNKYPRLQPREFVRSLREIADAAGCALIFDECVTGFRVAPGGAQEFYGVRGDIACYGKIIGGGIPFSAIAGSAHWMDALDGGDWQFGDDSYPEAGVTYFAGTFVRHPLALAAAKAVLLHLKRGGPALYKDLNERTSHLVERLNIAFTLRGAPVRAVHCASLWRLAWDGGQDFISLFYYLARFNGLHLYEQFGHFVTLAMGQAEIDHIAERLLSTLDELMALGFIQPRAGGPAPGGPSGGLLTTPMTAATDGPLAPGQTERWLAAAFDPAARRALNESLCISLQGDVDVTALQRSLQTVLNRHAAFQLRLDPEEPRQSLVSVGNIPIASVDLRGRDDAQRALEDFCYAASVTDFVLDRPPLAQASLLQLSDGRVVVHLVASHLVFDGWASSTFIAELAQTYRALAQGQEPKLPPAESPLAFAVAEAARMEGAEGQLSLQYWRQIHANTSTPVSLGDRRPDATRTYAADTARGSIQGAALAKLRSSARACGATLFQFLLSAVSLVLTRRSQTAEIVISIPFASQTLGRHGPLLADGVLDLPLRLRCEAGESASTLVARVRAQLLDALDHPLATQGAIARAVGMRSTGDRAPLTGIYFNLNPKVDLSAFAPLRATMIEPRKRGALNELFFNLYEYDDAVTIDLHHGTEWFSPSLAAQLVAELEGAASGMLTQQSEMQPVDPRLLAWNRTAVALDQGMRVDRLVAEQAARTPLAPAICSGEQTLSYADLQARTRSIAAALRARGCGPGARVGLCIDRGPDLIPALLAVLETGAAYVPLDPGFPVERLRYMASDAGLKLVISSGRQASRIELGAVDRLALDDPALPALSPAEVVIAPAAETADNAACYVIYTSGSTGNPKGVVVPHRAVCNFLQSMQREPGLHAGDRLLAVTTLSFDIAVLELLLPLIVGATVVIAKREDAMDGEALAALIASQSINVMQATPTTWHLLLDTGWRAHAAFRCLCGGEALSPALAKRLLGAGVELWNLYGPTETTVWSTVAKIEGTDALVTIGRPIDNTQIWVLDEAGQRCPPGTQGEICIGGDGVATGYHERAELTAERFIPDRFSDAPQARLYRTGDLGRWRVDGQLEHLGRLDHQVKIRGYRIELGEIEAQLSAWSGVARSVVVAREDEPGDVRIVGYLVTAPESTVDTAALRAALRAKLPDYMVPHHLVTLDALPLLPNGKIDRQALPPPPLVVEPVEIADAATPGSTQDIVLAAMRSVLQLPKVGPDDDFFAVGGHSLLAARLATALSARLSCRITLRTLFDVPTAAKLAAHIDQTRGTEPVMVGIRIESELERQSAPLTPMQERVRFMDELYTESAAYNTPSAHALSGSLDVAAFRRAFAAMVQRQHALRSQVALGADGRFELRVVPLAPYELDVFEPLDESALRVAIDALARRRINLYEAPLFHAALYRVSDGEHRFVFVPHHLVWDGWSFDVFYAEMAALYAAEIGAAPLRLPPPQVTLLDYATGYHQWLQGQEAQDELSYWRRRFSAAGLPLAMPTDRPRQAGMSGRGGSLELALSPALTQQLRRRAHVKGSPVSMLALAVLTLLLGSVARSPALVLGVPVRGREDARLEHVMGYFNNLLALPVHINATLAFSDFLRSLQRELGEAMAHQRIPFEQVSALPEVAAKASAAGLYQASYSFQDMRERITRWGPLRHRRVALFQGGVTEEFGLWLAEFDDTVNGGITYNTELYSEATALALRDRYLELLQAVLEADDPLVESLLAPADTAACRHLSALHGRATPSQPDRVPARAASETASPPGVSLSPAETALAQLWAELLDVDVTLVRPEDNFFDLGGDSILAMRAVEAGAAKLGIRVDGRRYIYESLGQIAATRRNTVTSIELPATPAAPQSPSGLFGRLRTALARGKTV